MQTAQRNGKDQCSCPRSLTCRALTRVCPRLSGVLPQMAEQRRKLPPMVNDRALFTKAAPFNDKDDPFYHSPSNKIGSNYSPEAQLAAAVLFEQFPQVRPRTDTSQML